MKRVSLLSWSIACIVVASCAGEEEPWPDTFSEVGVVAFEEKDGDPIVNIEHVGLRPGGGYILPDPTAGVVRLFDDEGRQTSVYGRPGEGPGELSAPTGALELEDGRLLVVQRGSPRLTIFSPDADPVIDNLPGAYGFWLERAGDAIVAGVATRNTRFAFLDRDGQASASFAARDAAISRAPFWIHLAFETAAVFDSVVAVNTSLFPSVRFFNLQGDSIGVIGQAPEGWVDITPPPVDNASGPGNRQRLEDWMRSFSIVRRVAAVNDSLLVLEHGRFDPLESDTYHVEPTTADVYRLDGTRIASGIELPGPVVGGGRYVLVLVGMPPGPWTIAKLRW